MASFLKRYKIVIVSLILAVFSLHLALTNEKGLERGAIARGFASVLISPVERSILGTYNAAEGLASDYIFLVGVKRANESLVSEVAVLKEEITRLKEEAGLASRLKEMLDYREAAPFNTIAATIIAFNFGQSGHGTRVVTINKGSLDNVKKDHAVISPRGIVGRVISVQGRTSQVLLNTDLRSDVDVMIQRSRVKAVAEGDGTDGVLLKYVRLSDDVQLGDAVTTSGISGVFPKGLKVGEVARIGKGKDNFFKHIEITPSVDVAAIEEVLVVTEHADFPVE
jgi:rod shape-determining protein MreC